MWISHVLIPVGYGYLPVLLFSIPFGSHAMQEFSYLGKIALLSISFSMILTQIITQVYKDSLTLTYTSNIKYLAGITILITTDRFFNTIIDDDYQHQAFTYIPDQNWWGPSIKEMPS